MQHFWVRALIAIVASVLLYLILETTHWLAAHKPLHPRWLEVCVNLLGAALFGLLLAGVMGYY